MGAPNSIPTEPDIREPNNASTGNNEEMKYVSPVISRPFNVASKLNDILTPPPSVEGSTQ